MNDTVCAGALLPKRVVPAAVALLTKALSWRDAQLQSGTSSASAAAGASKRGLKPTLSPITPLIDGSDCLSSEALHLSFSGPGQGVFK